MMVYFAYKLVDLNDNKFLFKNIFKYIQTKFIHISKVTKNWMRILFNNLNLAFM